jgi:2-keto-4-pentenoate hydratase
MSSRAQNPAKGALSGLTDIYLIGLRQGKIVAAGSASLFDDLKPGAAVAVHVDSISCVEVDEVRAYVEGNGL